MKTALRLLLAPYRFSVDRLFRMGQVGGAHWFDSPSLYPGGNHLYLYQDNAGTTPATAVGDTIGLSLDRAYGGMRGPELVTNGDFSNGTTGWTAGPNTTLSEVSGRLRVTNVGAVFGYATQVVATVIGKRYEVTGITVVGTATGARLYAGTSAGSPNNLAINADSGGRSVGSFTATATTTYISCLNLNGSNGTWDYDGISCREIPGTHLIQATGTARPTLSARVNLLLNTEQFDNAYWTKLTAGTGTAAVVTANAGTDPLGGSTADRVVFARGAGTTTGDYTLLSAVATGIVSGAPYLGAVWMKSNTGTTQTVCLYLAASASAAVSQSVGTTWTRVPVSLTSGATSMSFVFGSRGGAGFTSDQDLDILVWGADLRTADDAAKNIPAYQRVGATAADHDTDGFPHYALFDGTDDSLASTATVDGSATDKVTVVTGVTKNSDAAAGILYEHTASWTANSGSFIAASADSAGQNYYGGARGDASVSATQAATATTYAAPHSGVVTFSHDIAGDLTAARVNSSDRATATGNKGAGNFANATLYFGRRGGSTLPFNGRIYSLVFRFGAMSDTDRNRLEQWTKNLMRLP